MKIIIELTEAEVKGIRAYVNDTSDDKANKKYIQLYIQSIVSGTINAPQESVSNYIKKYML